jgi:hypothetical protein
VDPKIYSAVNNNKSKYMTIFVIIKEEKLRKSRNKSACSPLLTKTTYLKVMSMMLNAWYSNISAITWRSVLLVDETGENHRPVASLGQTLSHNVVSSTPRLSEIRTQNISGDKH